MFINSISCWNQTKSSDFLMQKYENHFPNSRLIQEEKKPESEKANKNANKRNTVFCFLVSNKKWNSPNIFVVLRHTFAVWRWNKVSTLTSRICIQYTALQYSICILYSSYSTVQKRIYPTIKNQKLFKNFSIFTKMFFCKTFTCFIFIWSLLSLRCNCIKANAKEKHTILSTSTIRLCDHPIYPLNCNAIINYLRCFGFQVIKKDFLPKFLIK